MSYMWQTLTSFQRGVYYILNEEIISVYAVGSLNVYNIVLYIIKMCANLQLSLYLVVT
jgi:hypothetical protein